jgi:alpha-L-fucosidase
MKYFNSLPVAAFCVSVFSLHVTAQDSAAARNYAVIPAGAGEAAIIRIAANLVPSARQLRWQNLEFTAFFHFGINTFTDREWGDGKEDISLFNPEKLDARQWVRIAKAAGIRQVILTCKHHDGFCLWPSRYTEHSVKNTPWKNGKGDVVKEVSEACHEYGVGFGVYLSPWDRNSPLYGDSVGYNNYFENQLTELLTNYGRVDEVWFDGANGEGPGGKKQVYDFPSWYALIRKMQPGAVIAVMGPDVRWVGTETGEGRLNEWSVVPADQQLADRIAAGSQKDIAFAPAGNMMQQDLGSRARLLGARALIWYPAETDVSIRPGWFWHAAENDKVKTPKELTDIYFASVGRNSLLLLNIPPDKSGRINAADSSSLLRWHAVLDTMFKDNLLAGASIRCGNGINNNALAQRTENLFHTRGNDSSCTINIAWKKPQRIGILELQESISRGQRVESFVLETRSGRGWKPLAAGQTIGYKRLIRFAPVSTAAVRLRIISARGRITLQGMGLYR